MLDATMAMQERAMASSEFLLAEGDAHGAPPQTPPGLDSLAIGSLARP